MPRVVVPAKYLTETRTDKLDYSSLIPAGTTISSAASVVTVWSGTDPGPSLTVTTAVILGSFINATVSGGVLGVIYLVTVRATLSDGEVIPLSYYLAVVPDGP